MIIRIVKMEFEEKFIDEFLNLFAGSRDQIRTFAGCSHLQLLQDESNPCVFFTYSHWGSSDDLAAYRDSRLFQTVWANTKRLFRAPPQAWSLGDRTQV